VRGVAVVSGGQAYAPDGEEEARIALRLRIEALIIVAIVKGSTMIIERWVNSFTETAAE
jgi:hypothetical protein